MSRWDRRAQKKDNKVVNERRRSNIKSIILMIEARIKRNGGK